MAQRKARSPGGGHPGTKFIVLPRAADRADFSGYKLEESPGSHAGQLFGCAGDKSLLNEVQMTVDMVSPLENTRTQLCT